MKSLILPPTVSTPPLEDFLSNKEVTDKLLLREKANIVEGYSLINEIDSNQPYKFFSEINVDNDKLWDVIKALTITLPDEVAFIYQHIDDEEPTYTKYIDKYELLNKIEPFKIELTQDGFLKFGIISHTHDFLEELFIEGAKYIQYWGIDKDKFEAVMRSYDIHYTEGLNYIDEFPLQTEVLRLHYKDCIETSELFDIFDKLFE